RQPGDRPAAIPVQAHGRLARRAHLRQAGLLVPHAAGRLGARPGRLIDLPTQSPPPVRNIHKIWGCDLPYRHQAFTDGRQSLDMPEDSGPGWSRRQVLAASGSGLLAATTAGPARAGIARRQFQSHPGDGTPEQIHLTWGDDPARSVVVSWASPDQAMRPRVRIGQRVIPAEERAYTDGLNGKTTWTYHARVTGLRPGATYGYAVTAENDLNA